MVVGEPFTIGSTVWTPADQLNYDAVGNAIVGQGTGVTAAHKTLPLPSYIEVTSLDTGHTILVRVERRGPMTNDALVELSPDAALQLGIAPGAKNTQVRVRRVNPPEQERALLRAGGRAPERMATPEGLLKVLRRKAADQSPLLPAPANNQAAPRPAMPSPPSQTASVTRPIPPAPVTTKPARPAPTPVRHSEPAPPSPAAKPAPAPVAKAPKPAAPKPAPAPAADPAKGNFTVQVAAFSSDASARKVAKALGGSVSQSGKFWRVRLGAFTNRAQASAALEKARRAGYSDARILRAD